MSTPTQDTLMQDAPDHPQTHDNDDDLPEIPTVPRSDVLHPDDLSLLARDKIREWYVHRLDEKRCALKQKERRVEMEKRHAAEQSVSVFVNDEDEEESLRTHIQALKTRLRNLMENESTKNCIFHRMQTHPPTTHATYTPHPNSLTRALRLRDAYASEYLIQANVYDEVLYELNEGEARVKE
ncbi:hypothetical protein HK104_005836, partial [Borealophlyctis nickersoniae]